jgi:hypothetical protein
MRKLTRAAVAGGLAAGLLFGAQPAMANEDDVIVEGNCSGASDFKLKLSPENGRIEVEFEVDQNVNGQEWRVVLRHNGTRFFRGVRVTQPPSGSFEVRRVENNLAGDDVFTARARNLSSDEVCRATATATF